MTGSRVIGTNPDDGLAPQLVIAVRSSGGLPVIVAAIGPRHADWHVALQGGLL